MKIDQKASRQVRAKPVTGQQPTLQWSSQAVFDVAAERRRQVDVEGYGLAHDDKHATGELASVAAAYAEASPLAGEAGAEFGPGDPPDGYPWEVESWKPGSQRRMLVKAAALILAEIERLDRRSAIRR